jgi:hypothetical protein
MNQNFDGFDTAEKFLRRALAYRNHDAGYHAGAFCGPIPFSASDGAGGLGIRHNASWYWALSRIAG